MPFLDALLAFSLTMLVVATVVSKIVDLIYFVWNQRRKVLEQMLTKAVEVAQDKLGKELDQQLPTDVKKIVEDLMAPKESLPKGAIGKFASYVSGKLPTNVSANDFVRKITATVGLQDEQLAALNPDGPAAAAAAAPIEDQVADSFKDVEEEFKQLFRDRTRWVAFVVALILAFAVNIDSLNILDKYINTPALSAMVAQKANATLKDADQVSTGGDASADVLKRIEESRKEIQQQIQQLSTNSFPIGWSYFPYPPYTCMSEWLSGNKGATSGSSVGKGSKPDGKNQDPKASTPDATHPAANDPTSKAEKPKSPTLEVRLRWIAGILLTSLFAGLGTPFWFDVIRNLTQLAHSGASTDSNPNPNPTNSGRATKDRPKPDQVGTIAQKPAAVAQKPGAVPPGDVGNPKPTA